MLWCKLTLAVLSVVAFLNLQTVDATIPLLLAITPGAAYGGLVTGIIGVILGGIAVAGALGKIDLGAKEGEEDEMMMMYGYGRRRRRSAGDIHEVIEAEKLEVEHFLDEVYRSDSSQCLEKMICHISKKLDGGLEITEGENDILKLIDSNQSKGYSYKKMLMARKVGNVGGDCDFLFDSCPLESSQMLDFIQTSERNILSNQFLVQ